jgi:hypothetical protein
MLSSCDFGGLEKVSSLYTCSGVYIYQPQEHILLCHIHLKLIIVDVCVKPFEYLLRYLGRKERELPKM